MRLSSEVRTCARALIAERLGLDFPEQRDDDLERRLLRAYQAAGAADPGRYVDLLAKLPGDSPEWRQFVGHFTVGETYFFRDRGCLEALEQEVLSPLIECRRREGSRRLRIWSAGCSSGEEPYSVAMLLDRLVPDRSDWSITILATDLSSRTLSAARRGVYREWSLRDTPDQLRRRYFAPRGAGTFELDADIRRMVTFAPLNLVDGAYPSLATNTSAMDLILCRNVIMYFTREAQRETVARLQGALVDGGWLVMSAAEASSDLLRPLEPVSFPGTVLFRKIAAAPRAAAPQRSKTRSAVRRQPTRRAPVSQPRREPEQSREPERSREPADLLELARAEADRGSLDRARDLCRDAVARDRLDPEAHLLLAAIEQERGDVPSAVDAIRSAIYLVPNSPSAHFILGSLLLRQGQTVRGRRSMQTVVALLDSVPSDQLVDGADALPAGRLLETAAAYLEAK